jgi:ribose-phosphate pyrophosphokinase
MLAVSNAPRNFRQALNSRLRRPVHSAFLEKYRSGGVVSGSAVVGDVAGKMAIIIDDLISSGTTLMRAAEACRARGALAVFAAASHGVFSRAAGEILSHPALERIVITNTVPPIRLDATAVRDRLIVLDTSAALC